MSARAPSRERSIGRKLLADPLLAEAIEAFAQADDRRVPNAVDFLLRRILEQWGWLAFASGDYVAGHQLLEHRRQQAPDAPSLARVIPLVRPKRAS